MGVALKIGLVLVGLGFLGFLAVFTVLGPLGPCASDSQAAALLIGLAGTGIGGLMCLVTLPVYLVRRHKTRSAASSLTLLGE